VVNPDGTVTYTPAPGFAGIDSFTYTVSDGTDTATGTVSVTVGNSPALARTGIGTLGLLVAALLLVAAGAGLLGVAGERKGRSVTR